MAQDVFIKRIGKCERCGKVGSHFCLTPDEERKFLKQLNMRQKIKEEKNEQNRK